MTFLESVLKKITPSDPLWRAAGRKRLENLTMPLWALGRLMDLAEELCAMTGLPPAVSRKAVAVFAADHGVAAEGVSQYPSEVTGQMVRNFVAGGAGINALARAANARVVVVDMGVATDLSDLGDAVVSRRAGRGTANIARGPAMPRESAIACVEAGVRLAFELDGQTDVFATGDMGIGNTTPSTAVLAAFTGRPAAELAGRGTGIDDERLAAKARVIERALAVNQPDPKDGLDVLAKVGGFEIGGIAGLILGAAALKKPVLVDGFISGAGALIAQAICPAAMDYAIAAHRSAERGHVVMLEKLGKKPLLALDLRLGEGTGAALAMPLLDAAARLLTDVATFEQAGVSRDAKEPKAP